MAAIFGDAAGVLTIGGVSAGEVIFSGGASGVLVVGGSAIGGAVISASASSTYTITGRAGVNFSNMRYGEAIVQAAYFGDTPVNVITVGDHVVLEW